MGCFYVKPMAFHKKLLIINAYFLKYQYYFSGIFGEIMRFIPDSPFRRPVDGWRDGRRLQKRPGAFTGASFSIKVCIKFCLHSLHF
jgi:hypothetical protein